MTQGSAPPRRDSDGVCVADGAEGEPRGGASPGWTRRRDPGTSDSWPKRLLLGALVFGLAWVVAGLALRAAYAGKVLPGTEVAGVDVGGMSAAEVERELNGLDPGAVTLTHGEQRFTIEGQEIRFRIGVPATAERALEAGRGSGFLGLLSNPWLPWSRRDVAAAHDVDGSRLEGEIAAIAAELDREAFAGALSIDPRSLRVETRAPRAGRTVNRRRTAATVLEGLRHGGATADLPVRRRPAPTLAVVEEVARRAEAYLESPLRLSGPNGSLRLAPSRLAPILAVESLPGESGRPSARLGTDPERLARLTDELAAEHDRAARDARISAPPTSALVDEQLDFSWRQRPVELEVRPARAGRSLRRRAAAEAIAAAVRADRNRVRLPTRSAEPALSTRSARKVTSLIGTFTTYFACCEPRVTNIQLIANAVDGTVVAPGEQFSLNAVAGPRTAAKGYVPAPFISDGELVDAVGGGVSQFSTTMFNAAYFAGLKIDSRQPHSFYIDRYPPGREATLDYGSIELLWTNDTDAPVLVRSSTTDTSVTVSLYGDNGGRRVEAITGTRQPVAGGDFTITVTRVIRFPGGDATREAFTTTYLNPETSG